MKLLNRGALLVVAISPVVGVLSMTMPVLAMEPNQATTTVTSGLEEIVVTARKRSEDVQKVPVSITAYTGDELKEQSVKDLYDVQDAVPGLLLQQGFDDPQSLTFMLRGRNQNDVTLSVDPAVGLYVDGLYVPRTLGMAGALVDVGRLEVLRGPQGTLYGRNTTGGAVSIYTNDPTNQFEGSADLTAGNYGAWNVIGIVNLPFTDTLAARFVVQDGAQGGYGHNAVGEQLGSVRNDYFRAKLRWAPNDSLVAVLSSHYEEDETSGALIKLLGLAPPGGGLPAGGILTVETSAETGMTFPQSVTYLNDLIAKQAKFYYDDDNTDVTYYHLGRWDTGLNIDVQLGGNMEFRSISGVSALRRNALLSISPIPVTLVTGNLNTQEKYYSEELELLGKTPTVNWIGGIYGGYENGEDDSTSVTVPVINPGTAVADAEIRNTSLAGFGQAVWEFVPKWHLTAGARYSSDTRRAGAVALVNGVCQVPAPGVESTAIGAAQCPRVFQNTFSKATWLASVDFQVTDSILLYTKAATGYRSGGQNSGGTTEIETFAPFAPETNIEYEAGVKSQYFDNRLRVNLAGYYDDYKNLQVSTAFLAGDGNVTTAVTNAAKAKIKGLEADVQAQITSQLFVRTYAAYTDAYYSEFTDFTGNRAGEPFGVPRWVVNLSGRYEEPTSVGMLGYQLDTNWKNTFVVDGRGLNHALATQHSYGLLNGRIDLKIDSWGLDLALFGRNLTGEKYLNQVAAHDQSSSLGAVWGYPGPPRTYGIEALVKFGGKASH
jgi:iron complex outermembrane receptor protein